jgi:hypothetical protein
MKIASSSRIFDGRSLELFLVRKPPSSETAEITAMLRLTLGFLGLQVRRTLMFDEAFHGVDSWGR